MAEQIVVIDMGTLHTRIGIAGQLQPDLVIKTSELTLPSRTEGNTLKSQNSGINSSLSAQNCCAFPLVRRGNIQSSKSIETAMKIFKDARNSSERDKTHIFLTVPVKSSVKYMLGLTEGILGSGVKSLAMGIQPRLSLLSTGLKTGMCIEIGHGLTQTSCFAQEKIVTGCERSIELAGCDVDVALKNCLAQSGVVFSPENADDYLRIIKESFCECRTQTPKLVKSKPSTAATLPDGTELLLNQEKYIPGERLFSSQRGIHTPIICALRERTVEERAVLLQNVVYAGGTALLPGFGQRLGEMMAKDLGENTRFNLKISQRSALNSCWTGGSVLAATVNFQALAITQAQLEEEGGRLIFQRFL